jgi:nucleoside-diphosphate-sugar epimerase
MREVVESLAFYLGKSIPRWSIPPLAALFFSRMLSFAAFRRGRLTTLYPNVQKWLSDNVYDGSRFERKFNFKPKMSLQEGLHREVEWYQNQLRKNSV